MNLPPSEYPQRSSAVCPSELDAETLNRLLNRIVVDETIDEQHVRHLSIEIHFSFKQMPGVECYTPKEQRPYKTKLQQA